MPAGTTPDEEQTAREAWRSFYELVFSRQSHDRMHEVCEAAGVTPGLMKALISMRPGEPRPMKELPGELRCDASYVTSLVDGLEERGFVERRAHPADRRAKVVVLTTVGERTREQLLKRMHQPPPCFSALTSGEIAELRDLLGKLVAAATTFTASTTSTASTAEAPKPPNR